MCTVTFFSLKNSFVITSNRDEKPERAAQEISMQNKNGFNLFYPKDHFENGTWIAAADSGNIIVLLNGSFGNHLKKNNYRRSRGLILLDIISEENPIYTLQNIDLKEIAPFTLVLFVEKKLFEFRWNGENIFFKKLSEKQPHIWSSTTLYNKNAREKRENLFKKYCKNNEMSAETILNFHQSKTEDLENGIMMKRENGIQTISISQVIIKENLELNHFDLINSKQFSQEIKLKNAITI